jgi:hypothetical protein
MKDHEVYAKEAKARAASAKSQAAYGEKGADMGKNYGEMPAKRDFGLGNRKAQIAKMLKEHKCGDYE